MTHSDSIKNIGSALLAFHGEVAKIPKNDTNPFFKSKYASLSTILDAVKQPLQKAGLTFVQFPIGENELETLLMHPESGEWMRAAYHMKPVKADPQSYGSVITYQRRYALGAILGLNIDEDDDGNKASEPPKEAVRLNGKKKLSDDKFNEAFKKISEMNDMDERDAAYKAMILNYDVSTAHAEQLANLVDDPLQLKQ